MSLVTIIPVHGMGNKPIGYSDAWLECLLKSRTISTNTYEWSEFRWDQLNDKAQKPYQKIVNKLKIPLLHFMLNWLTTSGLDVLFYRYAGVKKEATKSLASFVRDEVMKIKNNNKGTRDYLDSKVVILAHSLGSVLAYEALCTLEQPFLDNIVLFTFGSPLVSSFQRNFLGVKDNIKFKPHLWVNASGKFDPVGGQNLAFSTFEHRNQLWYNIAHDEFPYMSNFRDLFWRLVNNPTIEAISGLL